jgi:hypothetical protein
MESRSRLMRGIKRTPQSASDYLEEHQNGKSSRPSD